MKKQPKAPKAAAAAPQKYDPTAQPSMPGEPVGDADEKETPDDYQVEEAMRKLIEAEKVKNDPHMMPHVIKKARTHMKHVKSIADLKDAYNEVIKGKE